MTKRAFDVLVAGGGLAGMLAAAAFGSAGYDVVCIDPGPGISENAESSADTRTTALLLPAKSVLTLAGIWQVFCKAATPLRSLKIIEANENSEIQNTADFKSSEIGRDEFGWNIANRHLIGLLKERLRDLPTVTLLHRRRAGRVLNRDLEAITELSDGSRIAAKFVVAADGRNSAIRDRLGIGVVKRKPWQTALAFSVMHEAPHGDTSVEIHKRGGPFTLVPLPSIGGSHASAVVWIETSVEALRFSSLRNAEFNDEITNRSCGIFGKLELVSEIGAWPVVGQLATRFSEGRTALIAECAHVLPPVGAQGLNLSIGDIASICALLECSDLENRSFANRLASESRARRLTALTRCMGIEALNLVSSWESRSLRNVRARGVAAVGGIEAVRKPLMQLGLGAGFDTAT